MLLFGGGLSLTDTLGSDTNLEELALLQVGEGKGSLGGRGRLLLVMVGLQTGVRS